MSSQRRVLPDMMPSPDNGEPMYRDIRPFEVRYKGLTMIVDLPGYYPKGDGESVHIGKDMEAADRALHILKAQADGIPPPQEIRRVRKKLKLTQREAGELLRVGENAFDKYERGKIQPSGPTVQLLKLLDRHPELVAELREAKAAAAE